MVEFNVKLEENTQVTPFAQATGQAIEKYIQQVMQNTIDRAQFLEGQILNYYKLNPSDEYKEYFDIREVKEEDAPKETEEGKIINMNTKKEKDGESNNR